MHVGVGRHGGAHVDAYRSRVDQIRPMYAFGLDRPDRIRKRRAADKRLEGREQAFQNHGGLARTGDSGNHGKASPRNIDLQRMHGMHRIG